MFFARYSRGAIQIVFNTNRIAKGIVYKIRCHGYSLLRHIGSDLDGEDKGRVRGEHMIVKNTELGDER